MTDQELEEDRRYERKRRLKLIRRIVLIGGGIIVFIAFNWTWQVSAVLSSLWRALNGRWWALMSKHVPYFRTA